MNELMFDLMLIIPIIIIGSIAMWMVPNNELKDTDGLKYYRDNFLSDRVWRNLFGRW